MKRPKVFFDAEQVSQVEGSAELLAMFEVQKTGIEKLMIHNMSSGKRRGLDPRMCTIGTVAALCNNLGVLMDAQREVIKDHNCGDPVCKCVPITELIHTETVMNVAAFLSINMFGLTAEQKEQVKAMVNSEGKNLYDS